uniref:protein disulfide-isomerase n=1 Tax=Mola mola TaxID=94237 RepID=A0A3Q3X861_MOLML
SFVLYCCFSVLLLASVSAFVEDLDDTVFMCLQFYAPWCSFCKKLDPVWHQIGSELKSLGSSVNVGKSDATVSTGLAKEFRVSGYPAILMLKKGVKYNYSGPRTRDGIMDFANRVGGPLVRSLSSLQLFQHAMSRHDVMFVYVGATSPLKGNYTSAAEELIVHSYFFFASRDVLPKVYTQQRTVKNEERDGDLKAWINRERFPHYSKIDSYMLYSMGDSGNPACFQRSIKLNMSLCLCVWVRHFLFGFMEGSDYIRGLVMSDVAVPSFIAMNLSIDGYFLPLGAMETEQHLLDFLNGVLDGSVQVSLYSPDQHGGRRQRRTISSLSNVTSVCPSIQPVFIQAPLLGCFLVGFPFAIAALLCYLCCRAPPSMSDGDADEEGVALLPPSLSTSGSTEPDPDVGPENDTVHHNATSCVLSEAE